MKNWKLNIVLFLMTGIILTSCQKELSVKVHLMNMPDQNATLEQYYMDSFTVLASGDVKNEKLSLSSSHIELPTVLRLRFANGKYIFLSSDKMEHIQIDGNWNNLDSIVIKGSPASNDLDTLFHQLRIFATEQNTFLQIQNELNARHASDSMMMDLANRTKESKANFEAYLEKYIVNSPYVQNKLFALSFLKPYFKTDFIVEQIETIKEQFPGNAQVQYFEDKWLHMPSSGSDSTIIKPNKSAYKAKDIIGTNPQGQEIKLSDYQGKYVLVDFWASWCGPCRHENPNMVKIYNEFKNENFTIFGVSLDSDKENWVEAIKKDQLTWPQSSELLRWQAISVRDYNINSIPSNLLLDPDGNTLAANLSYSELQSKLSSIFHK